MVELMVSKHPNLPIIGRPERLPVTVAASNGFKETARYLYSITDKNIFNPEYSTHGVRLLINCIESMIFDIAANLVQEFPLILCQSDDSESYPIHALAKTLSALFSSESEHKKSNPLKQCWSNSGEYILKCLHHLLGRRNLSYAFDSELIYGQARVFLALVCCHVSNCDTWPLEEAVYPAMIEASKNRNIEFINEMLSAKPDLIFAHEEGKTIFWHAITNRHEKVFNLIYPAIEHKDSLLSCGETSNNILHIAAMLPPKPILDRTLKSPALQIQREFLWFKEVQSIVKPWYKGALNNDRLTPGELFHKSHTVLIEAGDKLMRDTAQSCTVVGALIVTIMFAAAFTVPGGNNQDTGYPLFGSDVLFKIFISCDALALSSSTASILIFLEILTSSYVVEDFVLYLPKKTMMGLLTLFISIAAMMITFCTAIAIMFGRRTQFILPIALLASSPVLLFMSSIFSLVYQIYMTTFGPSIFKRNTRLPEKKEYKHRRIRNPSSGDHIV